jgi:hypothetical protein
MGIAGPALLNLPIGNIAAHKRGFDKLNYPKVSLL